MSDTIPGARPARLDEPRDLVARLRAGEIGEGELPELWRSLSPTRPSELRGLWHGTGLSPEHAVHRVLTRTRWFGKLFRSDDDVAPIVRESEDGSLVADARLARGGATLRVMEHDGVTTAAMVYDGLPIVDLFVRVGPEAVLGVMTGRGAADDSGRLYFFLLEQVGDREVA